ncbi:MAG: phage major capsid protein [Muribaculaceae bacterium]|nr:phage major capsid protein [Muribaculaceae bacterium]
MKKKFQRVSEIAARLHEIANVIKKEERALNEAEKKEVAALEREQDMLHLQLRAKSLDLDNPNSKKISMRDAFRSMVGTGRANFELRLREEGASSTTPATPVSHTVTTAEAADGALLPLTIGDVVMPITEEVIYNKLGMRMPTGCAGNYEWPVVEAMTAQIAGENVEADEQAIDLDKVAVSKQRITVLCSATREALYESEGKLEAIVRELMPAAIAARVNQIICSPTKVTENCAIAGPFVGKTAKSIAFDFKSLNKAKGELLAKGLKSARMCWIMTEATKAELEATPKDTGSGVMIVENDKMCGLPIFCSEHIGEDKIGLGDFTYQVCNQFGDIYLGVDPYTGIGSNKVRFALNADFGTATLRKEAFELYTRKTN